MTKYFSALACPTISAITIASAKCMESHVRKEDRIEKKTVQGYIYPSFGGNNDAYKAIGNNQ